MARPAARDWFIYTAGPAWARGMAVAAAAALFLAFAGAFGTGEAPMGIRLVYWLGLMVGGTVWGSFTTRFFLPPGRPPGRLWLALVLAALAMAAPFTLVVWSVSRLMFGGRFRIAELPVMFLTVAAVSLVMTTINVLIEQRRETAAAPRPPKFLERLPIRLRGAEVWAVEAEDHYLRLHTSKGQDLILLRLADAVAELEGIEGAQVHRSWWVSRDAIADARRGDGRATLKLKDGSEVPVSRTYARTLRERGWI